jgi:hypothetical protein
MRTSRDDNQEDAADEPSSQEVRQREAGDRRAPSHWAAGMRSAAEATRRAAAYLRRSTLWAVLPAFLVWRAWLQVAYWMAFGAPKVRPALKPSPYAALRGDLPPWVAQWLSWDGNHFLRTVALGYVDALPGQRPNAAAVFPLYPMVVRGLGKLLSLPAPWAGLVVSHIATLVLLVFLYRLSEQVAGQGRGRRAVVYFLVFPTSFYCVAFYADSLLLALAAVSLDAALRGRWALASVAAALASATKPNGFLLGLALVVLFLIRDRRWPRGLWLLLTPTGLLAYMAFLRVRYGDPMIWLKVQVTWDRELEGSFLTTLVRSTLRSLAPHPWGQPQFGTLLNIAVLALMCVIGALLLRDREPWLALLVLGAMLIPVSTGTVLSISRLALLCFPAFIWMARHLRKGGSVEFGYLLAGAGTLSISVGIFVTANWLA